MRIASCLVVLALSLITASGCGSGNNSSAAERFVVDCTVYPPQSSSPYVLPYLIGSAYRVTLTTGHPADFRYAIDFDMPMGSTISAARDGTVYSLDDQWADTDHTLEHGNYISILHQDNTTAVYGHLTIHGALVAKGDAVSTGQAIALSGNSGASSGPHLHFEVARCNVAAWSNGQDCPAAEGVIVPTVFRNSTPTPCGLQPGIVYQALPY